MAITDKLTAIANAIRSKTGTTNTMTLDEMSNAITNIQTGTITSDNRCTTISDYLFYGCTNLSLTELPSGLTSIGAHAFGNCLGIHSLTFKGTPNIIKPDAFIGCIYLTTINVPWAEGAVENAPWSASNATINYNYVAV